MTIMTCCVKSRQIVIIFEATESGIYLMSTKYAELAWVNKYNLKTKQIIKTSQVLIIFSADSANIASSYKRR